MIAFFQNLGTMDYLVLAAAAFLVIRGFRQGCSGEMGRLLGMLAAVGAGALLFNPVTRLVLSAKFFDANLYAGRLIALIFVLVAAVTVWLGVHKLLSEGIQLVLAQPFDAIVGGVIGGIKALILVIVLCMVGLLNPREQDRASFKNKSLTVQKLAPFLKPFTSPDR